MTSITDFLSPISRYIWDAKYRFKSPNGEPIDLTVEDTWRRVAVALAAAEKPEEQATWAQRFYDAMDGFRFIPAGRILAGAGTQRDVTYFNCTVMGTIPDSLDGIFSHLREAALSMQQGAGIGMDFSTLRPNGAPVKGVDADASGPLSFMDVWDSMCKTLMSAGARRGAMMTCMRCDHPDIFHFVNAKHEVGRLTQFNMSVLVTDPFIKAVNENKEWPLIFDGRQYTIVDARKLWDAIMLSTYDHAEPGVIFIDRINKLNNLRYCETISATNPCGEQPLPPYGVCDLGSINLATLVRSPFSQHAFIDANDLDWIVPLAVRMLDNVYDVSKFPLPQQAEEARLKRRIGLGVTGLANALTMCGLRYGTMEAAQQAQRWVQSIEDRCYLASAELAAEKGAFPLFDRDKYLDGEHVKTLPAKVREAIHETGMRNSHLMSVAPTGTISLFAGNVSGGIEPPFAHTYTRKVLQPDGSRTEEQVEDAAYNLFRIIMQGAKPLNKADLPPCFVTAQDLTPEEHLLMLAAVQERIDTSISKTVNLPRDISFDDFKDVYRRAYDMGCKSCTTYRPNDVTGSVLSVEEPNTVKFTVKKTGEPFAVDIITDLNNGTVLETRAIKNAEVNFPYACPDLDQTELSSEAKALRADVEALAAIEFVASEVPVDEDDEPEDLIPVRPESLSGTTYKVRWTDGVGNHAYYVTINDDVAGTAPFEIFVNSKCVEHQAWVSALTRMVSAVFRRGGDLRFVVEELKAIVDPKGGAWIGGKYVPSLPALIGEVIERHLQVPPVKAVQGGDGEWTNGDFDRAAYTEVVNQAMKRGEKCPKCGSYALAQIQGCENCLDCGWSRCG